MRPAGNRRRRPLRALHRWLGISSAAFLLALCLSGLALNHADRLALDQHFLEGDWLLGRYGITGPDHLDSFAVGSVRVTLADGSLYVDARRVESARLAGIAGAAAVGDEIVVAGTRELVYLTPAGEVLEVADLSAQLPGELAALAYADSQLWLLSADRVVNYDAASGRVRMPETATTLPDWVRTSEPPASLRTAIERDYRGRGVSTERVLLDLHSGRLFGLSGQLILDAAALALIVLTLTGIRIWIRR